VQLVDTLQTILPAYSSNTSIEIKLVVKDGLSEESTITNLVKVIKPLYEDTNGLLQTMAIQLDAINEFSDQEA